MTVQCIYGWGDKGNEDKGVGVERCVNGEKWVLNTFLFADDTLVIAENESKIQNLVSVFDVCKRRKLK